MGIELHDAGIDKTEEIEVALRMASDNGSSLVAVIDDPVMQGHVETVIRIADSLKLPLVSQSARMQEVVASGDTDNLNELYRRGAEYMNRILRGAKPGNLLVQQPDKFNLILNLKPAKALGIEFPALLLARADEVIE